MVLGLRGPGETQLETDRRLLRDRIKNLNRRLDRNHNQKRINRYARKKSDVFQVSLVGYTNAGKSSLFNLLTKGETYVKDQLFATLDTKTKKLASKDGYGANVIISDTVGFVSNIPTNLIESFKATLEDLENADLLLHVIDVNDEDRQQKINEVNKILQTLDLELTPIINIFNKSDELSDDRISSIRSFGNICCSAITGDGLNEIKAAIRKQIKSSSFSGIIEIPLELGSLRSRIYNSGKVFDESLTNDGHLSLNIEIENKLNNGSALKKFKEMIIAQGVERKFAEKVCNEPEILIKSCKHKSELFLDESGYISSINAMEIAQFILENGGGRTFREQRINHNVGVELHVKITEFYDNNNPWATIYYDTEIDISQQLKNCVIISKNPIQKRSRILKKII